MEHDQVTDKESFVAFVSSLRDELSRGAPDWENVDLEHFLDAMAAWASAWDKPADHNPWRHAADVLAAATVYE